MSEIVDFYIRGKKNKDGKTLRDLLVQSNHELEMCHNQVQWLFPLHEASAIMPDAPVLTKEDVEVLRKSPIAKFNMRLALERYLKFYHIDNGVDLEEYYYWCNDGDHNLLRITRIIRSLRLFGLEKEAQIFYDDMNFLAYHRDLSEKTLEYWEKAMDDDVWETMQNRPNTELGDYERKDFYWDEYVKDFFATQKNDLPVKKK